MTEIGSVSKAILLITLFAANARKTALLVLVKVTANFLNQVTSFSTAKLASAWMGV
jgi:hypothetical protein